MLPFVSKRLWKKIYCCSFLFKLLGIVRSSFFKTQRKSCCFIRESFCSMISLTVISGCQFKTLKKHYLFSQKVSSIDDRQASKRTSNVAIPEAVAERCSLKEVLFEILQHSQENTCAIVSFLIKLQAWGLQLY